MNQEITEKKGYQITAKAMNESSSDSDTFVQHQTDFIYQCTIIQLKKLLENTLITVDEYRQMEQEIRQELCPYLHELYPS
ncbi:MAG: SHOCT domain-containing protein [Streptococcus parauberis]